MGFFAHVNFYISGFDTHICGCLFCLAISIFLRGGFSLFQAPNLREIMSKAPVDMSADASGVVAMSRVIGQLLGILVAAFIYRIAGGSATDIVFLFASSLALAGYCISQQRLRRS